MKNKKSNPFEGKRKIIPIKPPEKQLSFKERVKKFNEYSKNPEQHGKIFSELGFSYVDDGCDGWCPECPQKATCKAYEEPAWAITNKPAKSKAGQVMNKITAGALKQHIMDHTKEQLKTEIITLFNKFDEVREFYQATVFDNDNDVLKRYKAIIKNEFFPARGDGKARLSVAKKAILDYRKLCTTSAGIADIMLFYVETGVQYTVEYGDIGEQFYSSIESMYEKTLKYIAEKKLADDFRERCEKVLDNSEDTGWGFNDTLCAFFEKYYDSPE